MVSPQDVCSYKRRFASERRTRAKRRFGQCMTFGGFTACTLIDYPGKTSAMVYTIGCNFRCGYCHNPELVDETVEDTYSEEYVLSFLEKRVGLLDAVTITGGEPTMHEETLLSF